MHTEVWTRFINTDETGKVTITLNSHRKLQRGKVKKRTRLGPHNQYSVLDWRCQQLFYFLRTFIVLLKIFLRTGGTLTQRRKTAVFGTLQSSYGKFFWHAYCMRVIPSYDK
tara:strand:- start:168 stop:500 length:333 start_codon:yes stop_codon:yes gene_type:complete